MNSSLPTEIDIRATRKSAGAVPFVMSQIDYSRGELVEAPSREFVLCLVQRGSAEIRTRFEGGRIQRQHFHAGMFVPMTMPNMRAEFVMSAPTRHLVVSMPESVFDVWAMNRDIAAVDALASLQGSGFKDALLEQMVLTIWSESESNVNGALLADCLSASFTGAIFRRAIRATNPVSESRRLSRFQLAKLLEYLEQHLHQPIYIAELATIVDMHERAFSSAFKFSTGRTPNQFLIDLRVECAKRHLARSAVPIMGVAELTGFSDQAHLTAVFSRRVGVSPARYRRTLRF